MIIPGVERKCQDRGKKSFWNQCEGEIIRSDTYRGYIRSSAADEIEQYIWTTTCGDSWLVGTTTRSGLNLQPQCAFWITSEVVQPQKKLLKRENSWQFRNRIPFATGVARAMITHDCNGHFFKDYLLNTSRQQRNFRIQPIVFQWSFELLIIHVAADNMETESYFIVTISTTISTRKPKSLYSFIAIKRISLIDTNRALHVSGWSQRCVNERSNTVSITLVINNSSHFFFQITTNMLRVIVSEW